MIEGKQKRTPWFDQKRKPTRAGVYEVLIFKDVYFCKWFGDCWALQASTLSEAARSCTVSPFQDKPWRGLAQEVKS